MFAVVFEDIVFAVIILCYQIGTAPVVQASVYCNGAMFAMWSQFVHLQYFQ